MKITIESLPLPGNMKPHITISVEATPEELRESREIMEKCGYSVNSTPMAVLAQICGTGRVAAQEAFSPV